MMLKDLPGTMYVVNPVVNLKSDIKLDINKEKASSLGVPTVNIDRTVRLAVAGLKIGNFSDDNSNDFDILLTSPKGERADLDVFENLYVNNQMGAAIPLAQVADLKLESSPIAINHFNKLRTVSVSAFVQKGYLADNVISGIYQDHE